MKGYSSASGLKNSRSINWQWFPRKTFVKPS